MHLNLLLLLGIAVFGGTVGAKIFQKLHIPQVVGYIVIGILLGRTGLDVITPDKIQTLMPFNMFALGIIGFMIGGELRVEVFREYGSQFMTILLSEGLCAFFSVTVLTTVTGKIFIPGATWAHSIALGLLLGAISSATAPAATVDVLWEYKTRGVLTRAVLAIVALDDGLALLLYGVVASIAGILTGSGHETVMQSIRTPLWEILGAAAIGMIAAMVLVFLMKYITEHDKLLTFTLSSVLLVIGLSMAINVDSILAAMAFGALLANLRPRRSLDTFNLVEKFSPPIYVLFFVLVGARLHVSGMQFWMLVLAITYVVGRTAGKMGGAWFGARISKSPRVLRRYLGLCLFSQAGVAIGLSILASQKFEGAIGQTIILVITATTFLVQIIGPPCVKFAAKLSGEIGMNITEADLIARYKVEKVMNASPSTMGDNLSLNRILTIFSTTDTAYYPVLDAGGKLVGHISLGSIKRTLAHQETIGWLLACDIAEPVTDKTHPDTPLSEALEAMEKYDLEYLPVVDREGRFVGLLDNRSVSRAITAEVLKRHKQADGLIPVAG